MSVTKSYVKSKNICRVTFDLSADGADSASVLGDFNSWEPTPMKRKKNNFCATVELEPGREYQFRYLINGDTWANDDQADSYAQSAYPDAQNSVVVA
jgi:1,4-alpha-glucan branching enzyme